MNSKYVSIESCRHQQIKSDGIEPFPKIRKSNYSDKLPNREEVIKKFLPSSIGAIVNGVLFKIEQTYEGFFIEGNDTIIRIADINSKEDKPELRLLASSRDIETLIILPICPWGDIVDVMYIYLKDKYIENALQMEERLLKLWLRSQSGLIQYLLSKYNKPVYWGITESLSMLSVPYPHIHISISSTNISYKDIVKYRNSSPSSTIIDSIGSKIKRGLIKSLLLYRKKYSLDLDNRGWILQLFESDYNILNDTFINSIWRPIANIMAEALEVIHQDFYKTSLVHFYKAFINKIRKGKFMSSTLMRTYFTPNPKNNMDINKEMYKLYKENVLRTPIAWGQLMRFDVDNKVTLYSMISREKTPVGPFESIGIKLIESLSSVNTVQKGVINEIMNACTKHVS